jgi:Flp pilus assembly pilin Flp
MVARVRDESGQTMAEYATVLGVLIVGAAGAITFLAFGINQKLQTELVTILSGM